MSKSLIASAVIAAGLLTSAGYASAAATYPGNATPALLVLQDEEVLRDLTGKIGSRTEQRVKAGQIGYFANPSAEFVASVWFQQPFKHAGTDYHVAFVKLREIDLQTGEPFEAHAAGVSVSAITYKKAGADWEIVSRQSSPFTEAGTWGDAAVPEKVGQLELSKASTALLVPTYESGQGMAYEGEQIIAFDGEYWTSLGTINTSGNNGGNCDDTIPDVPACWSYTGTIHVAPSENGKMPDLLVVRTGTDYSGYGSKPKPAGNVVYKLKDGTYTAPSAE
ncbi:hypothetical protein ACQ7MX_07485 [Pseudomonas aeruginosa]|uniref:hypothetical protein n=1 Tax=Pseudomonas aeruginosa TaxID=287 RepID=UPI003D2DD59B